MSMIYCVHARNSVGRVVVMASHATIDEALTAAGSVLRRGSAFVWIVDGKGNLILPTDQVKIRLDHLAARRDASQADSINRLPDLVALPRITMLPSTTIQ